MGLARLVRARQRANLLDLAPGQHRTYADVVSDIGGAIGNFLGSGSNKGPGAAPMYAGGAAGSEADWNQYNNEAQAQGTAAAPTANYDAANATLGQAQGEIGSADQAMKSEGDALALQKSAAEGNQPSAAQIQMGQGVSAALRAQLAGAASARGGAYAQAGAQQTAAEVGGQQAASAVGQSAELRAQEMANARAAYSSAAQGMQQGSVAASGAEANIGQLQQQQGLSEAQLQAQQNALNVQGKLGEEGLSQNIDVANLNAATGNQALQANANQQNAGWGQQLIGGVVHAGGTVAGMAGADIDLGGGKAKKYADADGGGGVAETPSPAGGGDAFVPLSGLQTSPAISVGGGSTPAALPYQHFAGPAGGGYGPQAIALPNDADAAKTAAWYVANGLPPPGGTPVTRPGEGPPVASAAPPVPAVPGKKLSNLIENFGTDLLGGGGKAKEPTGMTREEMMAILGHAPQPAVAPAVNPAVAKIGQPVAPPATGQVAPVNPAPQPPTLITPMVTPGPAPIMAHDMDLRFSQGGFGSHGQEPNPGQPSLNAGPPEARGLARFAKRPDAVGGWSGIRAADADFQEPAKVDRKGGLAHWTLREEPDFIAAANQRNHTLKKIVTEDLTPKEKAQVLGPHGAGPIFSEGPDRDRLEMNDMNMGNGAGMMAIRPGGPVGANPGYGLSGGSSMSPMGSLQQFSNDATAYGRRGGAVGPGAAFGSQYADGELHESAHEAYLRGIKEATAPEGHKYMMAPYQPASGQAPAMVMSPWGYIPAQPQQMASAPQMPVETYPAMMPGGQEPGAAIARFQDGDLGGFSAVTKHQYADGPGNVDLTPPIPVAYPDAFRQGLVSGVQWPQFVPLEDQAAPVGPGWDAASEAAARRAMDGAVRGAAAPPAMVVEPGTYTPAMRGIREPLEFSRIREVPTVDPEADNASRFQYEERWKPPPPTLQERAASGLAALAQMKKNAVKGLAGGSALAAAQRENASVPSQRVASR